VVTFTSWGPNPSVRVLSLLLPRRSRASCCRAGLRRRHHVPDGADRAQGHGARRRRGPLSQVTAPFAATDQGRGVLSRGAPQESTRGLCTGPAGCSPPSAGRRQGRSHRGCFLGPASRGSQGAFQQRAPARLAKGIPSLVWLALPCSCNTNAATVRFQLSRRRRHSKGEGSSAHARCNSHCCCCWSQVLLP